MAKNNSKKLNREHILKSTFALLRVVLFACLSVYLKTDRIRSGEDNVYIHNIRQAKVPTTYEHTKSLLSHNNLHSK